MSEASHTSKPNHKKNSLGSHVVGASSGTLVVVIANALPEGSATLKELLIHSAEESPDDLDKNHQVKVDAHLVM